MNQKEYDLQSRVSKIAMRMGFKTAVQFLEDKSIAGFSYKEYEIAMGMRDSLIAVCGESAMLRYSANQNEN
jgi:hypothetical protein